MLMKYGTCKERNLNENILDLKGLKSKLDDECLRYLN